MKFKSSSELARYLGVSRAVISLWVKRGLPHQVQGLNYTFELEPVLRWLVNQSPRHKRLVESLAVDKEV